MTNYICINGKKAELTEEQMKALGIELPKAKNPFERENNGRFYRVGYDGDVYTEYDKNSSLHDCLFDVANYCTDKAIMEQRALHETLNRLLWRYSMEHDGDKIRENCYGAIKCSNGAFETFTAYGHSVGRAQFYDEIIAKAAITEIIEPFMKAHPEFKW